MGVAKRRTAEDCLLSRLEEGLAAISVYRLWPEGRGDVDRMLVARISTA